jgi:hypothetical protein
LCSTCDSRNSWLKFTHTQQENEEAITSFITCMMKKPAAMKILKKPAAMKILKKPSVNREARALRKDRSRKVKLAGKNQRAKENACARARKAASSNKPYNPRDPKLQALAMETRRATEVAQAASEKADKAHAAAEETQARSVVFEAATASGIGKAMEVAEQAHQEGRKVKDDLHTHELATQFRLKKVEAEASRCYRLLRCNEERLNTDDRKRGYLTP